MDNLIVAHGDLDGIISAVVTIRKFRLSPKKTEVIFAQPWAVNRVEVPDEAKKIFVVDIAVNNRNPEMTKNFIRHVGDRLARWYDHHSGWSTVEEHLTPAFRIDSEADSCAQLIGGDQPELVADAVAADTRSGELSPRAQFVGRAIKADITDDSVRLLAARWLLGDESARRGLDEAEKKYAEIQAETERLAAAYRVTGGLALVDARESDRRYDLTQLLLAGQKLAPFSVALTARPEGESLTVATSRKDVNLVELFNLKSGAPFRISLPIERLEEVLTKLETA